MNNSFTTSFVNPDKVITSPVNGAPIRSRRSTYTAGNKIYEEAIWRCPVSGQFIMKGLVSITEKCKHHQVKESCKDCNKKSKKKKLILDDDCQ